MGRWLYVRLIDPMFFQRAIERLCKTGFFKTKRLDSPDTEKILQLLLGVALYNRVMSEIRQDLFPAVRGDVLRNQNEVQIAFASRQRRSSDEKYAGAQHEREQKLHRLFSGLFFHPAGSAPPS